MGVYLRAKFEVSSINLLGEGTPQNEPLKNPPRLGLKNSCNLLNLRENHLSSGKLFYKLILSQYFATIFSVLIYNIQHM